MKSKVLVFTLLFSLFAVIGFAQSSWNIIKNNDTDPFSCKISKEEGLVFEFDGTKDYLHFTETGKSTKTDRKMILRPFDSDEELWEFEIRPTEEGSRADFHTARVHYVLAKEWQAPDQKFEIIELWGENQENVILTFTFKQ
jgi:hypothetical protein